MLSITSSQPLVWASAPSPAIAAIPATAPVAPVPSSSRQAQTGSGAFGRDTSAAATLARTGASPLEPGRESDEPSPAAQAAPLLPRPSPEEPDEQQGTERAQADEEQEQLERQAQEKALKQQLQDVISNVWKASAAVVDVALGRRTDTADTSDYTGTDRSAAPEPAALAVADQAQTRTQAFGPAAANDDLASELADLRAQLEVVGYDEQGHSSLAPLEAGSLISQRV